MKPLHQRQRLAPGQLWKVVRWVVLFAAIVGLRQVDPLAYVVRRVFPPNDSIAVKTIESTGMSSCAKGQRGSLLLIEYAGSDRETLELVKRSSSGQLLPLMVGADPDKYLLVAAPDADKRDLPRQAVLTLEVEANTLVGMTLSHPVSVHPDDLYLWTNSGGKDFGESDLTCRTPNEERSNRLVVALALLIVGGVGVSLPRGGLLWPSHGGEGKELPELKDDEEGADRD